MVQSRIATAKNKRGKGMRGMERSNGNRGLVMVSGPWERNHEAIMDGGILSTIGHTPLVRLTRVFPDSPFSLFAKLEGFNPGGSAKDRPALHILREAMRTGAIKPSTVVIESSSGNLGIGLAQACRYLGLRFICVVDPKATAQNIRILRAYGAQIDLVSKPDPVTGEFLHARINRVQRSEEHTSELQSLTNLVCRLLLEKKKKKKKKHISITKKSTKN